jgi:hypothetical protein
VILPNLMGSRDPNNGFRTDTRAKMVDDLEGRPDMLIGMNILKRLHLYIAFGEKKLYISEASSPPAQATGDTAANATQAQ